jgi:hypothetical protein
MTEIATDAAGALSGTLATRLTAAPQEMAAQRST